MKFLIYVAIIAISGLTEAGKVNFCYFPDYASNVVPPSQLKYEYCSHIGYSFFELAADGTCYLRDPGWETNIINALVSAKPAGTKLCPVIGGDRRSDNFGAVASNPAARQKFVQTCSTLMAQFGFDNCFDVDWEFPKLHERNSFISLLQDIKTGMSGVELFAAVSAGIWRIDDSYDIPALAVTVDYINLMTYDLHGSWDPITGANAGLYGPSGDNLNVDAAVNYYLSKGAPASKLILGVPFYGRTFFLTTSQTNMGAPSSGGDWLNYYDICADNGWIVSRDDVSQTPYAVKGNTWLSFDDEISIAAKVQYVKDNGLAGTLIWSLQQDDSKGSCGKGQWPLLTAVHNSLNS